MHMGKPRKTSLQCIPALSGICHLQVQGGPLQIARTPASALLAGETAVLAVFLNAEECDCCGVGGTAHEHVHVPPKVSSQPATAIVHAPANETSPQIDVTVDLTTALPPHCGSGSSAKLPYIFYSGALCRTA